MSAPKRVLMIAYHFPPLSGSSGIQRTLRFVQHLPSFGWQPLVLTAQAQAYERVSADQMADVPSDTVVERAFALDTARHLAVSGRYIAAMARPDRWVSWRFDAVRRGLRMIKKFKPDAIWSTYPIATAHLIALDLHRRTSLPWVADFRDPMAQDGYPADRATWLQFSAIERDALLRASASTFTTPSAAAEYRNRYPDAAGRVHLIENGYDEETFELAATGAALEPLTPGAKTLLHSGIVYPSERDPTALLAALRQLHDAGDITPDRLKLRFRAAVAEDQLRTLADRAGVSAYLEILPAVPYRAALSEMLRADGLLVLQASNCNAQIPAKMYEYIRAGRPVLCLTDPNGDTALTLRSTGINAIARLDTAGDIANLLRRFLGPSDPSLRTLADSATVLGASRRSRTEQLATILDDTTARRRPESMTSNIDATAARQTA